MSNCAYYPGAKPGKKHALNMQPVYTVCMGGETDMDHSRHFVSARNAGESLLNIIIVGADSASFRLPSRSAVRFVYTSTPIIQRVTIKAVNTSYIQAYKY